MQCVVAVEVQSWEILTQAHMTLKPDVLSASVRKGHELLSFFFGSLLDEFSWKTFTFDPFLPLHHPN